MKKLLIAIVFIASVASIFQPNRVDNSNYSVEIPPIVIKPPYKVQ